MTPTSTPPTVRPPDGWDILRMDPLYDGSCPCFSVTLEPDPPRHNGGTFEGHCWRVCGQCDGCGLHFEGDRALAEKWADLLTGIDWYGRWNVVEGLSR